MFQVDNIYGNIYTIFHLVQKSNNAYGLKVINKILLFHRHNNGFIIIFMQYRKDFFIIFKKIQKIFIISEFFTFYPTYESKLSF